jgi:hypothetical protein
MHTQQRSKSNLDGVFDKSIKRGGVSYATLHRYICLANSTSLAQTVTQAIVEGGKALHTMYF